MSDKPLIIEKKDNIASIILNRPRVMNAMSKEMILGLRDAVLEIGLDEDIRVLIIKGAGNHFCSGADLNLFTDNTASYWVESLTPIIFPPQVAIVGAGRIGRRVAETQDAPRHVAIGIALECGRDGAAVGECDRHVGDARFAVADAAVGDGVGFEAEGHGGGEDWVGGGRSVGTEFGQSATVFLSAGGPRGWFGV